MCKINVSKDFYDNLIYRKRIDGDYSAEAFVYDLVLPMFKDNYTIEIDFNGVATSYAFIEEAFSLLHYELGLNYNLYTHKFNIICDDKYLIQEIESCVENPIPMKFDNEKFKGYYIPTPIDDLFFSMEKCELVKIDLDYSTVSDWYSTGEILNLVYDEESKKYINDENCDDWFWYRGDEELHNIYKQVQNHFTNDKFRDVLQFLYSELLEGKQIISTFDKMMFLQRFSYISNYEYNF